jgi:hypothetical protein
MSGSVSMMTTQGSPAPIAGCGRVEECSSAVVSAPRGQVSSGPVRTATQIEIATPDLDWIEQGRLHHRGRQPLRRRELHDLPRQVTPAPDPNNHAEIP